MKPAPLPLLLPSAILACALGFAAKPMLAQVTSATLATQVAPNQTGRMAKTISLTSVKNPWDDSTLKVTYEDWNRGSIKDSQGRPILLGEPPSDPGMTVVVDRITGRFTNPYTGKLATWRGPMHKGASIRWGKFTLVAREVVEEVNGVPLRMQKSFISRRGSFLMKWNTTGFWSSSPGAVLPGGDPNKLCNALTDTARANGQIPKNFRFRHVGNGKFECRP